MSELATLRLQSDCGVTVEIRLATPGAPARLHEGSFGIRVRDVEASRAFCAAVLEPLGLRITASGDGGFSVDELFVGGGGTPTAGLHLAFQADSREVVDRFHAAALAAGAIDNGAPGERAYHPGYYAAYALDPDS